MSHTPCRPTNQPSTDLGRPRDEHNSQPTPRSIDRTADPINNNQQPTAKIQHPNQTMQTTQSNQPTDRPTHALDQPHQTNNPNRPVQYRDMLYWKGNDCRLSSVFRDGGGDEEAAGAAGGNITSAADGLTATWAAALDAAVLGSGQGEHGDKVCIICHRVIEKKGVIIVAQKKQQRRR